MEGCRLAAPRADPAGANASQSLLPRQTVVFESFSMAFMPRLPAFASPSGTTGECGCFLELGRGCTWLALCMTATPALGLRSCLTRAGAGAGARSALLSGTRTSRLYQALVQPGRAVSASCVAAYPGEKHPGARPPPLFSALLLTRASL